VANSSEACVSRGLHWPTSKCEFYLYIFYFCLISPLISRNFFAHCRFVTDIFDIFERSLQEPEQCASLCAFWIVNHECGAKASVPAPHSSGVGFQGSMPSMPGAPQQLHAGQSHMPGSMAPGMQTMSQPGSPAGGQPGSASRIDPNQIPRPQSTASPLQFDTRVNGSANLPPVL
jgi:hypothetical protein